MVFILFDESTMNFTYTFAKLIFFINLNFYLNLKILIKFLNLYPLNARLKYLKQNYLQSLMKILTFFLINHKHHLKDHFMMVIYSHVTMED